MNNLVMQALRAAIEGSQMPVVADLTEWRKGRIVELEATIREFCEYVVDTDAHIGMSAKWHAKFNDLCEAVGFDADEHGNEGFDRADV